MTPLANRIAAHLERMYHEHRWVGVGHGSFARQGLPGADGPCSERALRELEAAGVVSAEVTISCPDGHALWAGPEATKPTGPQDCYECHGNGCAYEDDDLYEKVRFSLTPATIERLDAAVPFAPSVYARGLQAAEGCREIERLVQGLALVLGLVRR